MDTTEDHWVEHKLSQINKTEPYNILLREYLTDIPEHLKLHILDSFDQDDCPEEDT